MADQLPPGVYMVAVGGRMFRSDQEFNYYNGFGSSATIDAAQASNIINSARLEKMHGRNGWQDTGDQEGVTITVNSNQRFDP